MQKQLQYETLEIVKRCLAIDEKAHQAYTSLAQVTVNPNLKLFWQTMASEEEMHVNFWNKAVEDGAVVENLPGIFDDADAVIAELDEILPKVDALKLDEMADLPIEDTFILAYRLEFYMLHPAFETLYHLLRVLVQNPCPEDEYENHIDSFVNALSQYGKVTPALELLGETLQRLWRENKKLAERATRDSLTHCLNRQAFEEIARHLCYLSRRKKETVGMMMIDLDHFKHVNDELGHHVGDAVLKCVVQVIQDNVRDSDVVARYGGEEFIVCMPNITLDLARTVAERVRLAFAEMRFGKLSPTLSAGVTVMELGEDIEACIQKLIRTADSNLYKAKESGRNRVV